jgi:hypothetical protein
MKKKPIVAAVLNLLLFGAGTLYVGRRMTAGWMITIGGTIAQIAEITISPVVNPAVPAGWPFLLGGLVVLKIGLAVDGWNEATQVNG